MFGSIAMKRLWMQLKGRSEQAAVRQPPQEEIVDPEPKDERWRLEVPFRAPELDFTNPQTETISGYTVTIKQGSPDYGRIVVNDLASAEEAGDIFAALKRSAVAASLNLSTGIRVTDNLAVILNDDQLPQARDQPFACRQGRSLARAFLTVGKPRYIMSKIADRVRTSLDVGFHHAGVEESLAEPLVALACQLFIDSHFESTGEARFLSLIGVLEVLKDKDPVSEDAVKLVDRWIEESSELDKAEAASFRGSLRHLKTISINRGIRSAVERHLGAEKAREASRFYNLRSSLVHDGMRPDDLDVVVRKSEVLARELLVSILTTPREAATEDPPGV